MILYVVATIQIINGQDFELRLKIGNDTIKISSDTTVWECENVYVRMFVKKLSTVSKICWYQNGVVLFCPAGDNLHTIDTDKTFFARVWKGSLYKDSPKVTVKRWNAFSDIGLDIRACQGNLININSPTPKGNWSILGLGTIPEYNINTTNLYPGVYTLQCRLPCGITKTKKLTIIGQPHNPFVSDTIKVAYGKSYWLKGCNQPDVTNLWTNETSADSIEVNNSGWVKLTVAYECGESVFSTYVLFVESHEQCREWTIYPNPIENGKALHLMKCGKPVGDGMVSLVDMKGIVIKRLQYHHIYGTMTQGIPAGVYILFKDGEVVEKIAIW
jgi:hypothetical protein